jgi:hypothetical protein
MTVLQQEWGEDLSTFSHKPPLSGEEVPFPPLVIPILWNSSRKTYWPWPGYVILGYHSFIGGGQHPSPLLKTLPSPITVQGRANSQQGLCAHQSLWTKLTGCPELGS